MLMGHARASTLRKPGAENSLDHGGSIAEARALFPAAPEPWVDLSTGINPVPYPVPALSPDAFARLPERQDIAALECIAATAYGVSDPELAIALPGSQILVSLLPHLFPLPSVTVLGPTYNEHAAAWARSGAEIREVRSLADLDDSRSVVLCNPNNPDGRRIAPQELIELSKAIAAHHGLMVVDEAFADLERPPLSLAPHLPLPGTIVLRSFGKAYGLAGLRLGFALAEADLAATIRAALGPWPVSGVGVEIGSKALSDRIWLQQAGHGRASDAARLDALLEGTGLAVRGGTSLFRLVEHARAEDIFHRLGEAGIYVRRFEARKDWLRFGLPGDAAQWRRLEDALS